MATSDPAGAVDSVASAIGGQSLGPAPVIASVVAPVDVSAGPAAVSAAVPAGGSVGGVVAPATPAPDRTRAPTPAAIQRPRFLVCFMW